MKNFLRALKFSWVYRRRLILSLFCAMMAAAFWGLNLTAVYPVLKILGSNQSLQFWIDQKIDAAQAEIEGNSLNLAKAKDGLRDVENWKESRTRENKEHELSREIARIEG